MFIVIEYIAGTYDNLHIANEDGEPTFFDTKEEAEKYGKDNCAWNYQAVELL